MHNSQVAERVVDDHLRRLLLLADRAGARFPAGPAVRPAEADRPARRRWLRDSAAAGMTVLIDDGALPLSPARRIALIGAHATDTVVMGGGSSMVTPPHQVSIAEGLTAVLGDRVTVMGGVEVREVPAAARAGFVVDPVDGQPGMRRSC